jgi:hypothetical protein
VLLKYDLEPRVQLLYAAVDVSLHRRDLRLVVLPYTALITEGPYLASGTTPQTWLHTITESGALTRELGEQRAASHGAGLRGGGGRVERELGGRGLAGHVAKQLLHILFAANCGCRGFGVLGIRVSIFGNPYFFIKY